MGFEKKSFPVSVEAVWAVSAPPSGFGPFLPSHDRHFFSAFFGHFRSESRLISSCDRKFPALFCAPHTRLIQRGQVRPRFSKQVGARFALFRRADFRTGFCTRRASARSCAFGNCEIRQRPAQSETSKDPTFLGIQHFFMGRAALKYENFISQSVALEFLDPVRFVRSFFFRQGLVTPWSIKAVARFSNVADLTRAWVDESVDEKAANVSVRHTTSSVAQGAVNGDLDACLDTSKV